MDAIVYDKVGKEAEKVREALYGIYPQETITDAAIASFDDGADGIPVKALTVGIEPVQDLHGYDHPWPGGGNENLWIPPEAQTYYGVDVTLSSDGGIILSGTPSTSVNLEVPITLKAGTYYLGDFSTGSFPINDSAKFDISQTNLIVTNRGGGNRTATLTEDISTMLRIRLDGGFNYSVVVKPMLISGSSAPTAYSSYSNICPISGWTGTEIEQAGKNLFGAGFISGNLFINAETGSPNEASTTPEYRITGYIDCFGWRGQVITQNHMPRGGQPGIAFYDSSKYFISGILNNGGTAGRAFSFTVPENAYFMRTTTLLDYVDEFQLELGSTATDYVPYTGNQISVNWEDEAGTVYSGKLAIQSDGMRNLTSSWKKTTLGDITELHTTTTGTGLYAIYHTSFPFAGTSSEIVVIGEATTGVSYINRGLVWGICGVSLYNEIIVFVPADSTVESVNAALSGTEILCRVNTSEYSIDGVKLPSTTYGTNNIWASTGNIEKLTYRADLGKYIDSHITTAVANALNA